MIIFPARPVFNPFSRCMYNIERVTSFVRALVKIIFSLGYALKHSLETQARWYHAFKGHNLTFEDVKEAFTIIKAHTEYAKDFIGNAIQKANSLADLILGSKHDLIQQGVWLNNKKELFKHCFQAIMEINNATVPLDKLTTICGTELNKLFGDSVHLLKEASGKITCIAERALIGQGQYNDVHLAVDLWNSKLRAFRKLPEELMQNKYIDRLAQEHDLHFKLQDISDLKKGMVQIYHKFANTPHYAALLKFCEAGDLDKAIAGNILSKDDKKAIALDVFTFMMHLHNNNYVYSDFKTENILLVREKDAHVKNKYRAKMADFGGIHAVSNVKVDPIVTPMYLAPESYRNGKTSKETDCWALGVFLHELKYMTPPQFIDDSIDLLEKNVDQGLKKVEKGCQCLAQYINDKDPYDQLILGALRYHPKERLTAKEMCERLHDILVSSF